MVLSVWPRYLARLTQFLLPVAPFALDFVPHSRTSGMLRVPASAAETGLAEAVSDEDIAKGLVDERLCPSGKRKELTPQFSDVDPYAVVRFRPVSSRGPKRFSSCGGVFVLLLLLLLLSLFIIIIFISSSIILKHYFHFL